MWDWFTYYLFFFALLLGYVFLSNYDRKTVDKGLFLLYLGLLPTFLLLALRGREVGIDLERYETRVLEARFLSKDYIFDALSEPIFKVVEWSSFKLGGIHAFIVITSILEYLFIFIALRNLHEKKIDIRFVYLFFFSYVVIRSFNIVRNGLAWTISLCAYTYLIGDNKGDKRKFWTYALLAMGIHNSAAINIIIYFICWPLKGVSENKIEKRVWIRQILIVVIFFVLIFGGRYFIMDLFVDFSSERYRDDHFAIRDSFGFGNIAFRLPFLVFLFYSFKTIKKVYGNSLLPIIMLAVFDLVVANLRYIAQDFERLSYYTGLGEVILWATIAVSYRKKGEKMMSHFVFIVGLIWFTYYMVHWGIYGGYGNGIGIMPYKLWE